MVATVRLSAVLTALVVGTAAPALSQSIPTGTGAPGTVWPDEGPRTWAPRPTETAITANDLRTRLYQFADDSMQGRRMGEPGNFKGTAYIASEFERLGLRPAGDDGTYFQVMPFGPVGFDSASSRLMVAGNSLRTGADWVPVRPSGGNGAGPRAQVDGVDAVYAGTWGDTTVTLDPAVFGGKVAVFTAAPAQFAAPARRVSATPPSCAEVPNRFGADAAIAWEEAQRANPTAAAPRRAPSASNRDDRAARAGAVAVLIVGLDDAPASVRQGAFAAPMSMHPAAPTGAVAPGQAVISRAAAQRIFGKSVDGLAVGTSGAAVSANWSQEARLSSTPARNVVAVIPGSDPALAGQYVLLGAHNDHVGISGTAVDHDSLRAVNMVTRPQGANDPVCTPTADQQRLIDSLIAHARSIRPPRADSVMNGADDDGSGSMVLLEVAEQIAARKPARSVIFVSHQGEEAGLLGSRWFTDHPTIPLDSVVGVVNMDMLGKGRNWQVKFGGPNSVQMLGARRLSREFGDVIDSVNANIPEPMAIDKSWDVPANPLNRFCRSDQVNYVRHDIPTVYMSLGYALDYHQATDEPQYIDYDHTARLGRFIDSFLTALADRPNRPAIGGANPDFPTCGR